jgi:hypothetical protein
MAQLSPPSIYRLQGRWPVNFEDARRPEVRKKPGTRGYVSNGVAVTPVITGHAPHDSLQREPALRHVVRDGDNTTAVRVIRATDGWGGKYGMLSRDRARVDQTLRYLLVCAYPWPRRTNRSKRSINGDGPPAARSFGAGGLIPNGLLYHGTSASVA